MQSQAKPPQSIIALSPTRSIVISAMFTVLVYGFTMIHVNPLALPGGLVHLGNVPVFVAAILFGKKIGAVSAAMGMTLFNLTSPYVFWAPYTFVIGLAMGFAVGAIAHRRRQLPYFLLAMLAAALIRVIGYYLAQVILFGDWRAPLLAVPANITQIILAAVIVLLIIKPLRLAAERLISRDHIGGETDV